MKTRFRITGFAAAQKALRELADAVDPAARRAALDEGAQIVLTRMEQLVPVLSGDLRNSLAITPGERADEVRIGPAGKDAWRAHFIEFGTVHHPAEPFIRPAFDAAQADMTRAAARRMEATIRAAVKGV